MGKWNHAWVSTAWWHPDGWVIYGSGEKSAWPTDWSEPNAQGIRTGPSQPGEPYYDPLFPGDPPRYYYPFQPNRAGGHLYFVPQLGAGVDGQGYLINSKTGADSRLVPQSVNEERGGVSHIYTWEKIEPQPGEDGFLDGRLRPKWKLNCQTFWTHPNVPVDYHCGRIYPQWPPRPKFRRP